LDTIPRQLNNDLRLSDSGRHLSSIMELHLRIPRAARKQQANSKEEKEKKTNGLSYGGS